MDFLKRLIGNFTLEARVFKFYGLLGSVKLVEDSNSYLGEHNDRDVIRGKPIRKKTYTNSAQYLQHYAC